MQRLIRSTLVCLLATLSVSFLTLPTNTFSQNYDVKKTYWGMNPLDVQLSEERPKDGKFFWGKYLCHSYYTFDCYKRRTSEWRYLFDRNRLVKVFFLSDWRKDQLGMYDSEIKYFSKLAGGQPIKSVDDAQQRSNEWMVEDRTFIQISLSKEPSKAGTYHYQALFTDAEYKKKQDAKKNK